MSAISTKIDIMSVHDCVSTRYTSGLLKCPSLLYQRI